MIDQALNLLTLHIIWKARRLSAEVQPSPDDGRLGESFREQRESLLKRLVEYSVGSQSNTIEGVRKAVSAAFASSGELPDPDRYAGLPKPLKSSHSVLSTSRL
jgi:hypothetical protein